MNSKLEDNNATISFFKEEIECFVKERRWTKFHTPKNLIQALSIEVSELSEIFLFKDISLETINSDKELLENISDEISDVFIYLISLVNSMNLDLTNAFIKKLEKNKDKYSIKEFNNGSYQKL
ncbi:MAG: nucleotide pyrophosphohydrolase [Candidatus Lokiarchaeota archaeon]|nr:nucleotide pyrophosphohydrolase [Candidatus Lokiarchaeota archaeon]